jgi:hypothetical protein
MGENPGEGFAMFFVKLFWDNQFFVVVHFYLQVIYE